LGLRGAEIELNSPPGVQRIVVAGDSFAWGWGVNDGADFSDQLMLGRSDREVMNLGVINFNTFQEKKYFERVQERFHPDVVVLAFCQNDVVGATYDFLAPGPASRAASDIDESRGLHRIKRFIAEHSAIYHLANDVVMSHRGLMQAAVAAGIKDQLDGYDELDYNLRPFLKQYPPELDEQWNAAVSQVLDFKSIADSHGMRFIVAVIPALQSVDPDALEASLATSKYAPGDFDLDRPNAALGELAHGNGIEIVDPTAVFREATARGEKLYLIGDQHFNAEGHRLFAKAIAEYLDRSSQP
jgi:lysophospholipase L1-like esterase